MTSSDSLRGVFIEVSHNVFRKILSAAIGLGLDAAWCFTSLRETLDSLEKEVEDDQADHRG